MLNKIKVKLLNKIYKSQELKKGGERQASVTLDGIAQDHKKRYYFASKYLLKGQKVLDMACGAGYGSFIMATNSECSQICSVDISEEAIKYGKKFYKHPKINFYCDSATTFNDKNEFDVGICLETIEHVLDDRAVLLNYRKLLKKGAKLIISHPNEVLLPWSKERFPYHVRHYTRDQMKEMLLKCGFSILEVYGQKDKHDSDLIKNEYGSFLIYVCEAL